QMSAQYTTANPTFTREPFVRDASLVRDDQFQIDSNESVFDETPIYARQARKKKSGGSSAILLGVPAVLVAGAVAFLMLSPKPEATTETATTGAATPALTSSASPSALDTATTANAAASTEMAAAEPATPLPVNPTPA